MKVRIALELFFLKNFLDFEKIDSKNLNFKSHKLPTALPLTLKTSQ